MLRAVRSTVNAVALVLFGLVVALALVEGGFRLAGVGGPAELGALYDRPTETYVPHPDRQHPWAAPGEEVLRVAVIGDSFTVGHGNDWSDAFPRRLERLLNLNAGAPPARVKVYARPGTTTWQQLAFLERALADSPDLVILAVFLNDTEDHRDPRIREWQVAMLPRVPTGWSLGLLRRSRALAWLYLRYEHLRSYRTALELQDYVLQPDYPGFQRFEKALRRFRIETRRAGVRLVAVVWPSMGGLGADYPHRVAHERIGGALRRAKIPFIDLLPRFEDKSPLRLAVLPEVDNHPNEIAHRIAASAIFQFLLQRRHLDRAYRPPQRVRRAERPWEQRLLRRMSPFAGESARGEPPDRSGARDEERPAQEGTSGRSRPSPR